MQSGECQRWGRQSAQNKYPVRSFNFEDGERRGTRQCESRKSLKHRRVQSRRAMAYRIDRDEGLQSSSGCQGWTGAESRAFFAWMGARNRFCVICFSSLPSGAELGRYFTKTLLDFRSCPPCCQRSGCRTCCTRERGREREREEPLLWYLFLLMWYKTA